MSREDEWLLGVAAACVLTALVIVRHIRRLRDPLRELGKVDAHRQHRHDDGRQR